MPSFRPPDDSLQSIVLLPDELKIIRKGNLVHSHGIPIAGWPSKNVLSLVVEQLSASSVFLCPLGQRPSGALTLFSFRLECGCTTTFACFAHRRLITIRARVRERDQPPFDLLLFAASQILDRLTVEIQLLDLNAALLRSSLCRFSNHVRLLTADLESISECRNGKLPKVHGYYYLQGRATLRYFRYPIF